MDDKMEIVEVYPPINKLFTQLFVIILRILIRSKEKYKRKIINGRNLDGGGLLITTTNKCKVENFILKEK